MPPPVRVGSDFPFVLGSDLGIEDHLEDCLVQGLEQLLVQLGPGTADGGRRHRVVYKFVCKNEKRAVTTDEWLESDVSSGMWRCLDAIPHPGANHS